MVHELHNIMPIENIPSVMKNGILSFEKNTKLPHSFVAMVNIQGRGDKKAVPGTLALHKYANLYFDAQRLRCEAVHKSIQIMSGVRINAFARMGDCQ